ncbi:hypothetical protein ABUK73_20460 [Agrobacterium sp. BA1120]|uniref:hypothetical protein n=1 Tax=Agrobacterium sp. BA1120 TaxID=3228927 RepID=UPI00336A7967
MKDSGSDSLSQNTRHQGAEKTPLRGVHRAEVSLMITRDSGFRAKTEITNGGLISIAAMVSSILLSTAVLVHVAVSAQQRKR